MLLFLMGLSGDKRSLNKGRQNCGGVPRDVRLWWSQSGRDEPWFQAVVVARWRAGEKLVPVSWIETTSDGTLQSESAVLDECASPDAYDE